MKIAVPLVSAATFLFPLLAVAWAGWAVLNTPEPLAVSKIGTAADVTPAAAGPTGVTEADFQPVWAKPLRRPLVDPPTLATVTVAIPAVVYVPPLPAMQLKGVFVESGQSRALLEIGQSPPVLVTEGDLLPGLAEDVRLVAVERFKITLEARGGQVQLALPDGP